MFKIWAFSKHQKAIHFQKYT